MKLKRLFAASCSNLYFHFFSDDHCSVPHSGSWFNSSFTSCRSADIFDLSVTNMMSVLGACSATATELPLSSSSYVRSSYDWSQSCDSTAVQTRAYALDSCFGTNEGTSTMYSFKTNSSHVTMTNYYNNNNCSSKTIFQSSLNISVPLCRNESGQTSSNTSTFNSVYVAPGSSDNTGLSDGAVAGIVVGAVVGAGLIGAGVYVAAQSGAIAGVAGASAGGAAAVGSVAGSGGGAAAVATANPMMVAAAV